MERHQDTVRWAEGLVHERRRPAWVVGGDWNPEAVELQHLNEKAAVVRPFKPTCYAAGSNSGSEIDYFLIAKPLMHFSGRL